MIKNRLIKIDGDTPSILLCTYGTIRKRGSLYSRFLENKSLYQGEITTYPEYQMWNNGFYPIVSNGSNSIVCDVFKISQQKVFEDILILEGCSGILDNPDDMYQLHLINTEFGQAYMFLQPDYKGLEKDKIKTGDWLKRPLPETKKFINGKIIHL